MNSPRRLGLTLVSLGIFVMVAFAVQHWLFLKKLPEGFWRIPLSLVRINDYGGRSGTYRNNCLRDNPGADLILYRRPAAFANHAVSSRRCAACRSSCLAFFGWRFVSQVWPLPGGAGTASSPAWQRRGLDRTQVGTSLVLLMRR